VGKVSAAGGKQRYENSEALDVGMNEDALASGMEKDT
jgi:hypothetical protein